MAGTKRVANEELTSDNVKQPRHVGQLQHSNNETRDNNGNTASSATGPPKPQDSNDVKPGVAAHQGQTSLTDTDAATIKPRPFATPRNGLAKRPIVTTKD